MSSLTVSGSPRRPPRSTRSSTLESVRSFTSSNGSIHGGNLDLCHGYFGHLDHKQSEALEDLKLLLGDAGVTLADGLSGEAQGKRTAGVSDLELLWAHHPQNVSEDCQLKCLRQTIPAGSALQRKERLRYVYQDLAVEIRCESRASIQRSLQLAYSSCSFPPALPDLPPQGGQVGLADPYTRAQ